MLTEKDKAYIDGYIDGHMHAMCKLQQSVSQLCEFDYMTYLRQEIEKTMEHKGEEDERMD